MRTILSSHQRWSSPNASFGASGFPLLSGVLPTSVSTFGGLTSASTASCSPLAARCSASPLLGPKPARQRRRSACCGPNSPVYTGMPTVTDEQSTQARRGAMPGSSDWRESDRALRGSGSQMTPVLSCASGCPRGPAYSNVIDATWRTWFGSSRGAPTSRHERGWMSEFTLTRWVAEMGGRIRLGLDVVVSPRAVMAFTRREITRMGVVHLLRDR